MSMCESVIESTEMNNEIATDRNIILSGQNT